MNREYLRWYSQRLHRDMEMLVFGHAGAKVLVFPTREGRFFEYEQLGLVASLADKLQAGHLRLYCIEGLAADSLYGFHRHPAESIRQACGAGGLYPQRGAAADGGEEFA